MIKTPGSRTDRIAQACDRCRSKKIRCDGKRPHCSQCLAVGFECKTSDKLSRRAYPRGYTESLEDRVRQLESENTKLTNLLDIKDEQMEMMAKVESVSPLKKTEDSPNKPLTPSVDSEDDEAYFAHQINTLAEDGSFHGSSAGGIFIDALLVKLESKDVKMRPQLGNLFANLGKPFVRGDGYCNFNTNAKPTTNIINTNPTNKFLDIDMPSRLTADKLISTYFHEWNTMYAILDQYHFLDSYQSLMNSFSIAEHSHDFSSLEKSQMFIIITLIVASLGSIALKDKSPSAIAESWRLENEWKRLFTIDLQSQPTLLTAQALVLAQLYSLYTGQIDDVWHYRSMTISICHRLGLHRCHKSLKLSNGNALSFYDQEMRRRVFWVAYSLDCFAAALLGAPRLFLDKDIGCALPSNIDDEMLRGEVNDESNNGVASTTQMTCPLSVIHYAQILANILDTIYAPAPRSHTYKTVVRLEDKLQQWRRELPDSLRFEFANGAPVQALAPLHQKSPLLLVLYHYARILIHLPAISASSLDGSNPRGSASVVAVAQNAKVSLQVTNYLKARAVIPCLAFNPARMSVFFTAIVLYGAIDYSKGGALLLDIRKILASTTSHLSSDLHLRRPGSLNKDSFQILQQVCENLLNPPTKKDAISRRRRPAKKKEADKTVSPEPLASPLSTTCLQPIAPAPLPVSNYSTSPTSANPKTRTISSSPTNHSHATKKAVSHHDAKLEWTPGFDHCNSALNDLLVINMASSKSRSASVCGPSSSFHSDVKKSRSNSLTSAPEYAKHIPNPIDLFFESGMLASGLKSKTASTVNLSQLTSFQDTHVHRESQDSVTSSLHGLNSPFTTGVDSISSFHSVVASRSESVFGPESVSRSEDFCCYENASRSGRISRPESLSRSESVMSRSESVISRSESLPSNSTGTDNTSSPSLTYSDDHCSLLSENAFSSPEILGFFFTTKPVDTFNNVSGALGVSDALENAPELLSTINNNIASSDLNTGPVAGLKRVDSWTTDPHLKLPELSWNDLEEIHLN